MTYICQIPNTHPPETVSFIQQQYLKSASFEAGMWPCELKHSYIPYQNVSWSTESSVPIQLPATVPEKTENYGPGALVPAAHMKAPGGRL